MSDQRVVELTNQLYDLIDRRQWDWVLAALDELAELRPYEHTVFYNRAIALARMGQFEPAVRDLERALELEPDYALARRALARVEQAMASPPPGGPLAAPSKPFPIAFVGLGLLAIVVVVGIIAFFARNLGPHKAVDIASGSRVASAQQAGAATETQKTPGVQQQPTAPEEAGTTEAAPETPQNEGDTRSPRGRAPRGAGRSIDLDQGGSVSLGEGRTFALMVDRIVVSDDISIHVEEFSVDYDGPWAHWAQVVSASYLSDNSGLVYRPIVEKCTGWQDGYAKPGDSRGGTIVFPGFLPHEHTQYTLHFAFDPSASDAGMIAVPLDVDLGDMDGGAAWVLPEDHLARGKTEMERENFNDAIEEFTLAIEDDPDSAEAYNLRGLARSITREPGMALEDCSEAIELNPDYADAYNNRGTVYLSMDDIDRAIEDFTSAIEINTRFEDAYYNRGRAYAEKREYDQAIADLTRAIEIDPDDASNYHARGLAYNAKGDIERARADFDKAVELDPSYGRRGR
jgi:tetratricopeptide (TPR) repeat protein